MRGLFFLILLLTYSVSFSQTVKVGVWNNPPLSIISDNNVTGFIPDIFEKISKDQDIDFVYVKGGWEELYTKLKNGEIDIFMPIGYSEKRLNEIDFSKYPLFTNWGQIICKKDKYLNSISELNGKRIAIQKNDLYFTGDFGLRHLLEEFKINSNIIFLDNYIEGFHKILNDEADCALVGKSFILSNKDNDIKPTSIIVQPLEVHFGYSKKLDNHTKSQIDEGIKKLIDDKDSYYYHLLNYLNETGYNYSISTFYIQKFFLPIITFIAILVFVLLLFNVLLRKKVVQKTYELHNTVEKLKNSESKLKAILNSMPNIIFVINKDFRYLDVITNRDDLLLSPKDQIIGKSIYDFFTGDKLLLFENHIKDVIEHMHRSNILYDIDINGNTRYFESFGVPMVLGNEVFGLFQIVERTDLVMANDACHRAMMELSVEKDKLNRILNSVSEMVIFADPDGQITFTNRSTVEFFGKSLIGGRLSELIFEDIEGNRIDFPVCKDSKNISHCRLNNNYLVLNDKKYEIEGEIQPIYDSASRINGILIVLRDVTNEKRRERELIKADKLETIGRIAAGIAHDFNNYLGAIQNYVSFLQLNDDNKTIAESIISIIKKSQNLTKQLLTFSKGGTPVFKIADVGKLVKEVATFSLRGSNIKEEFDIPDSCFCAKIDEGFLSQVVSNLVINARDAMGNNGKIKISISKVYLHKDNEFHLEEGEYIKVSIKDSGPGVPQSLQNKIFDPFFTTKSNGTGLGLTTSYAIIKNHKGELSFLNHEDGCEFFFFIPSSDDSECDKKSEGQDSKPKLDGKIKVLYMDDENILRDSFGLLMEAIGAVVVSVQNGEEALKAVQKERFDIIVLDLTIKTGMSGKDTIKKLKEMKVDSFFVVSSGYSDDPVIHNFKEYGFDGYLPKPFSLKEVKEMLENYKMRHS
ncbi:MAG: ATP-binding protein [Calditerrivibrio sp.]|uniref:ATP-binding protein n=1 Tax=Calditerrivibrio sp. TaxID=2792612 RepID=UPI003D127084